MRIKAHTGEVRTVENNSHQVSALSLSGPRDFGIVIPHLDNFRYLSTCLWSIFTQEGNSTVQVHIQDGGETDGAEKLLRTLEGKVQDSRFLISYVREPDRNAADAINRGMSKINAEMVTWLGADDFLMPGALQSVFSLRQQHPHIRWVTGIPHIVSEEGIGVPTYGSAGFYRDCAGFTGEGLRRGLHAGELNHGWIQQEGTFWERSLWEEVGGLNTNLQLAFDFDLWCRLAMHSDLIEVMAPLGAFRKRTGQASSDTRSYASEMERITRESTSRVGASDKKVLLETTWVAKLGKKSYQWELVRKRFSIWIPGTSPVTIWPGGFRHMRAIFAKVIRRIAPRSVATRFALLALGKLRKFKK